MTGDEWLSAFAAAAGVEVPTAGEIDALLDLAGVAAHASERTAAPITCWIAAVAGLTPADALALGESLAPTGD
jgi:hypothetical protein